MEYKYQSMTLGELGAKFADICEYAEGNCIKCPIQNCGALGVLQLNAIQRKQLEIVAAWDPAAQGD